MVRPEEHGLGLPATIERFPDIQAFCVLPLCQHSLLIGIRASPDPITIMIAAATNSAVHHFDAAQCRIRPGEIESRYRKHCQTPRHLAEALGKGERCLMPACWAPDRQAGHRWRCAAYSFSGKSLSVLSGHAQARATIGSGWRRHVGELQAGQEFTSQDGPVRKQLVWQEA